MKRPTKSVVPCKFRLDRLLEGFETLEKAEGEDAKRVRLITASLVGWPVARLGRPIRKRLFEKSGAEDLRRLLKRGILKGEPQPTLASALNMRELRLTVIGALLEAVDRYADADLKVVTVINRQWLYKARKLDRVTAAVIKRQFRTHLERAGILAMPGFLVAFLHGEFEPTSAHYQLHYHVLTTARKAEALLIKLRKKRNWGYVETQTGAAPIKTQKIADRVSQLSYLLKSYWPARPVVWIDGHPKRVRKGQRIKGPYHTQYLLWLHRQDLNHIMITNRCVYRNSKFHFG